MTEFLDHLMRDLGHLFATVECLEKVQDLWAMSVASSSQEASVSSVDSAPPSFQAAYVESKQTLREMPRLLYEMSLVHANSIFEVYIAGLLDNLFNSHPRMLLTPHAGKQAEAGSKKLDYKQLIAATEQGIAPTALMAEQSVRQLMFNSIDQILKALRTSYGLSTLTEEYDRSILSLSLIRNCIVHNGSITDDKLEEASQLFYRRGKKLVIDRLLVTRAITLFRCTAQAIDDCAIGKYPEHLSKPSQKGA